MTSHVTSRDGTRIGYVTRGSGPGVALVQGAMADVDSYSELARALSGSFTVHAVERRGRGLSPRPYDAGHDIARDAEDLDAVLAETGTTRVFGLSSGAVIALEAARTLDRVTGVAVFEPPFYADGIDHAGVRRINCDIERGDWGAALVDSLLTSGTAPRAFTSVPRPVLRLLGRAVLFVDARRPGSSARLRDLLPGVRYDFHDVAGVDGRLGQYADVDKPVLLLSGTKSPAFLRQSVRTLEGLLPDAQRVELDGLGHDGPWNESRGGGPQAVAAELSRFFG